MCGKQFAERKNFNTQAAWKKVFNTRAAWKQDWYGTAVCNGQTVEYFLITAYFPREGKKYGVLVATGDEWVMLPVLSASQRRTEELLSRMIHDGVTPLTVPGTLAGWSAE